MIAMTKNSGMKQFFIAAVLAPTIALIASSFKTDGDKELEIGNKIPMLETKMEGIDGSSYSLLDLKKENGLMVVFSCNTCPFVVGNDNFEGWEKQYNDLYNAAEKANIGFVLINSNEAKRGDDDSMEEMILHAKEKGYKMKYLVDEKSKLADAFGAKTTPHLFVVDSKGKLAFKGSIDNSWDSKRTEDRSYAMEVIDHLANGTALKDNTSQPRGCSIKRK